MNTFEALLYDASIVVLGCFMAASSLSAFRATGHTDVSSILFAAAGAGIAGFTVYWAASSGLSNVTPDNRRTHWITIGLVLVTLAAGLAGFRP